ncbi:UNVERIFIED_CONTAM: hypothetical protein FKN15_041446 [Acipenser sinensis]
MTRKCVCELCNCGRHRCPHQPTGLFEKSKQPCSVTEYAEKYPEYEGVHPRQSMKPKQEYKAGRDLMDGTTTFKRHRCPHQPTGLFEKSKQPCSVTEYAEKYPEYEGVHPRQSMKPKQEYKAGRDLMDGTTTFKPISRGRRSSVPFQGNTTMKEDFRKWEVRKQEMIKNKEEMGIPAGKFDGLSTFQAHYIPHQLNPIQSFKPQNVVTRSLAPFYDGTMYRTEYTSKKPDLCPASFQEPPGYVFDDVDHRGHKYFRKMLTPLGSKSILTNGITIPSEVAVMS